ncbi:hypothetical protein BRADI_3g37686v3 [Brachypodium distachyon]|uniref:Uncharacterized protein n=1 Tax=Brachypodium distachyon TaxID=15368 RepID=A0A2K2D1T7_BRADI|nr:hypothetical protein BRADI_3g37686v3 [Brachypodium distachyon]
MFKGWRNNKHTLHAAVGRRACKRIQVALSLRGESDALAMKRLHLFPFFCIFHVARGKKAWGGELTIDFDRFDPGS